MKDICCICLSKDRKLYQLCRISNGVNSLYILLSLDIEAYREGFYKDTAKLYICWECKAVLRKLSKFCAQACSAQKLLTDIDNGRISIDSQKSLSKLSIYKQINEQIDFVPSLDNFIDCGVAHIKEETDLCNNPEVENNLDIINETYNYMVNNSNSNETHDLVNNDNFEIINYTNIDNRIENDNDLMNDDMIVNDKNDQLIKTDNNMILNNKLFERDNLAMKEENDELSMNEMNLNEKVNNTSNLAQEILVVKGRKRKNVEKITCYETVKKEFRRENKTLDMEESLEYLSLEGNERHVENGKRNDLIYKKKRKKEKSNSLKSQRSKPMTDERTDYGFKCPECEKYFNTKNLRYKHMLRYHREGFKCDICGKRVQFKDLLAKHIRLHESPLPREECPKCRKMIRTDLMKVHAKIHDKRERFSCVECEKEFACRASYEHHLKYSSTHADVDVVKKYKCAKCDKGYKSRGELDDHVNYKHLGKTRHECPLCGKALATRRCIRRHVRRAHENIKEGLKDKICQRCGKAFRDKKGLREHEFIHTGERPLSCELCGCTFRHSASLYTHRKRVHHIHPEKKSIEVVKVNK